MRLKYNNMNELNKLIQKNGAVVKQPQEVVAKVATPQPKPTSAPVVDKPIPVKQDKSIESERMSLLAKQNQALSAELKAMIARLDQQDRLIADLKKALVKTDEPKPSVDVAPQKGNKFKFKIIRNDEGFIDSVEVNSGDEEAVVTDKQKIINLVKDSLKRN